MLCFSHGKTLEAYNVFLTVFLKDKLYVFLVDKHIRNPITCILKGFPFGNTHGCQECHRYPSAFLPHVLTAINSHHSPFKSVSAPTNRPINHSHQHRPRPVPTSPLLPSTPLNNVSPCSHAYSSHQIPPPR